MSLLLTIYNSPDWEVLTKAAGLPVATEAAHAINGQSALLQPMQQLSMLPELMRQLPNEGKLWLAVVQAEYFLANAIEEGITLEEASIQWQQTSNELLTLQRQHRQRLQLFNLHQALTFPAAFCDALAPVVAIKIYSPLSINSNLSLLAACQYVSQNNELKALNIRLQASTLSLCENETLYVDVGQIIHHHQEVDMKLESIESDRSRLLQLVEKLTLEKEQLIQTKNQHEATLQKNYEDRSRLEEQLNSLKSAFDTNKANYNQLTETQEKSKSELLAIKEERDLILLQLHKTQEQLETYHLKPQAEQKNHYDEIISRDKKHSQEIDKLNDEIQQTKTRIANVENSNQLLQQELQNEQQKSKHAILARDKQQAREVTKIEAQLRQTKARAASAEYACQLLQKKLDEIRNSTLWKSTAPVRALGRLVKKADATSSKLLQDTALLLTSEYFDVDWYLTHYPDVANNNLNPAEHYLRYGANEGRLPGPLFDGNWYLQQYPDVAKAGVNPLLHFIKFGQQEGRSSSPKMLVNNQNGEESNE